MVSIAAMVMVAFVYQQLINFYREEGLVEMKSLVRGENFVVFGEAVADPRNGNVNQVWLRKDCLVNYMRR